MLYAAILAAMLAATPQVSSHTSAVVLRPLPMTVSVPAVTPASITFTAPDPDTNATVAGSASATLKFTLANGNSNWTVAVSAPASFTNCSTVPVAAVKATATCTTVSGTSSCTSGNLSTAGTQIASGRKTGGAANFVITISFSLTDSWEYIASSTCALAVTYTITG